MLMATQLLAGSGGSVYLCVRNDGSYCCLDAGPSTCTCSANRRPTVNEEHRGCKCGCHVSEPCDEGNHVQAPRLTSSGDPSGCTHILLSHNQVPARVAQTSSSVDIDRLYQVVASLPGMLAMDRSNDSRHSPNERFRPPTTPSQTMTVLAWVLIQC